MSQLCREIRSALCFPCIQSPATDPGRLLGLSDISSKKKRRIKRNGLQSLKENLNLQTDLQCLAAALSRTAR